MPIDYKNYPANWKTEIRPAVLERAANCCEICKVPNYQWIIRGKVKGVGDKYYEIYQLVDGSIFDAENSELLGYDYLGEYSGNNNPIKVVLTIAHMDHDISNNDMENLKALCQRCHNRHDMPFRIANRKAKKGQLGLWD
jgi:hypothetical protein